MVRWKAPQSPTGTISRYRVRLARDHGNPSRFRFEEVANTDRTNNPDMAHRVGALEANITYQVSVRAWDNENDTWSPWSPTTLATTGPLGTSTNDALVVSLASPDGDGSIEGTVGGQRTVPGRGVEHPRQRVDRPVHGAHHAGEDPDETQGHS